MTVKTPQIECINASFAYEGRTVLQNVTFSVSKGDYLCILGENGTGKSTLVKGMLGLLKPQSGEIRYHGINNTDIGYLPQTNTIPKGFPASCFEAVLQGCTEKKRGSFFSKAEKDRALDAMRLLEVDDLKNVGISTLSGGQKQRVLLARALCAADKVLLLDEPVSGLDPLVSAEMYGIIEKLNREKGITVIMISHDTETAAKYADKILHLKHEVLFFGDTDKYLKTELSHQFLGGCGHEHH